MRQLKIAWLLPTAWFYWQPAISELTKQFPKTKVFTALWPGYAKGYEDTLQIEIVGQRKVLGVKPETTGYGSTFTYVSPAVIFPLIRFRPHIIFTNAFGVWTLLALLLKPIWRWKVVIAYEGSSPGVDFRNSKYRLFLRRVMTWLADACMTNSHSGQAYLTDVLHVPPEQVFVHPYEVPAAKSLLDIQDEERLPELNVQRPIFLFVGRIMPRKGLHFLLDACLLLQQRGYDNYTLLVVGDGEQQAELEEFSRTHGLETCVKWLGRVDYAQISAYFRQADVFVLPTLEDTWGVVVLEAMLFSKPVLCSTGAGTAELIVHGQNGYLFEPGQIEKLAEFMQQFIDKPEIIERMSQSSEQIMAAYTPESAAQFLNGIVQFLEQHKNVASGQVSHYGSP